LGFRIWIDNNEVRARMKGDILETMAKAIENSAVVVICLSQSYKDSNNCRWFGIKVDGWKSSAFLHRKPYVTPQYQPEPVA